MLEGASYWSRRKVSRRSALRGAAAGVAGLAGAALIGCSGDDDDTVAATSTASTNVGAEQQSQGTGTAAAAPTVMMESTSPAVVAADQIKIPPGIYDSPIPATAAEANPMVNAVRGGVMRYRYLDPPRMDINRMLSCTIFHTMDYTNSKLTRGRTGASAHPFLVEIEGDLAESWEKSPDAMEFTFHLHRGVKLHNKPPVFGREFTSHDVKASLERYRAGGTQKDVYAPVTAIETPDDYTVVVQLDQPLADFATSVSSWSFLWPQELVDDDGLLQEQAIGTGAFVQEEWTRRERSVFTAHPDYFEQPLPFLDGIEVVVQNDRARQREAFLAGNFWGWSARDDEDAAEMATNSTSMVLWKYPRSRGANVNGWHFQMNNPRFADPRVRRAISLAFDRDEYDNERNAGDNAAPGGAFSNPPMPWSLLYDDYPDASMNGKWYRFNPVLASQMMQGAGYTAERPLEFELETYYFGDAFRERVVPGINASLPEVRISFRQLDLPTHVTLLSDGSFQDAIGIVWGPPAHSMDQWIFPWWHSQGGLNFNNVSDPDMDSMLEAQRASSDLAEKQAIWRQVWERIHDQVWDAWWPEPLRRHAHHNWIMNMRPHALMGEWVCYTSGQSRAMWMTADAPQR